LSPGTTYYFRAKAYSDASGWIYGNELSFTTLSILPVGWSYRKSHVINPASGAGTNYQVMIIAHYGSGTDSGADVYLNGKCRTDFGDVRFTASDGMTLLDYWMESKVDGDYAVFWVEITDDLSTNPVTIYIYYGNPSATTTSNGDNTFLFFDDFPGTSLDSSKWTVKAGTPVVENSYVKLTGSYSRIQTIPTFSRPTAVRIRAKMDTTSSGNAIDNYVYATDGAYRTSGTCYVWAIASNYYTYSIYFQKTIDGVQTSLKTTGVKLDSTVWGTYELCATALTFRFFYDSNEDTPSVTDTDIFSGYLELACYGTTGYRYWDWIAVRKYVDPEPSHGSWGSEETVAVAEAIVAKNFPMDYLPSPAKAAQLTSKVSGATITTVSQDYPLTLIKKDKAQELKSKWT
jgi:hypothetical protein